MKRVIVIVVAASAVATACASVADLDVKYTPEVTTSDGGSSGVAVGADGGGDGPSVSAKIEQPPTRDGGPDPVSVTCACADEGSNGFCCAAATPFCTEDLAACEAQKGTFLRCSGPSTEGDPCCLHRHPTGAETALAGSCAEGTSVVCTTNRDCPNGGTCTLGACPGGITIGTCDGTPVCPP